MKLGSAKRRAASGYGVSFGPLLPSYIAVHQPIRIVVCVSSMFVRPSPSTSLLPSRVAVPRVYGLPSL